MRRWGVANCVCRRECVCVCAYVCSCVCTCVYMCVYVCVQRVENQSYISDDGLFLKF